MGDRVRRFLLQGAPVRGEIVSLDTAWAHILQRHDLPAPVLQVLGELSAAAVLLAATLKFDGALMLQIQGDGPVALVVVESQADGRLRATAKLREGATIDTDATLNQLVNARGRGRFAVTLDPRQRSATQTTWQGIVPFEGDTVAEVLEHYMARSEQLPTRLWLAADTHRATGFLLQRLPDEGGHAERHRDADGWERMQHLASTLTREELLSLPSERMLTRLFWQEPLHGMDDASIRFGCRCSRDKVRGMLEMLGRGEVEDILAERGIVEVRCDFCNEAYAFDAIDCARIFVAAPESPPGSSAQH